jgi:hypothetical protein
MRHSFALFAVFALLGASTENRTRRATPRVRLQVVDSSTQRSITSATAELEESCRVVRANRDGLIMFDSVASGLHTIDVRAIGYAERRVNAMAIESLSDSTNVLVEMVAVPITMRAEVIVDSRTATIDGGGFETRRRKGLGHFISPAILDAEPDRTISAIIAEHVPGIEDGTDTVYSKRGSRCPLDVYVDGTHRASYDLRELMTSSIAAVEVYTATNIPVQFKSSASNRAGGAQCGALVIWLGKR